MNETQLNRQDSDDYEEFEEVLISIQINNNNNNNNNNSDDNDDKGLASDYQNDKEISDLFLNNNKQEITNNKFISNNEANNALTTLVQWCQQYGSLSEANLDLLNKVKIMVDNIQAKQ
jgi:hypothetical protein